MKKLIALILMVATLFGGQIALAETKVATPAPVPNIDCFQKALDVRDTAIIAAVQTHTDAVLTALNTRKDALKSAWNITIVKERRTAINTAWNTYRKSIRDARTTMNSAKKTAWNAFYTSRKACGKTGSSDDQMGSSVDSQL